ncbi:GNAT family N-acetyltransferase [Crossiella cryophila]|uniref:Putative GNAT superfamily acetyltransferase n=1 Tax=Crossiella cryophila TaxID=43355 RepID=A0A7W7FU56_9PSEU|nr:GNAT family N-acetyltransferase [Crossiella cryophila]MBB4678921.1 putative GNAT superfamily acetyltransferase [Crossiella cryophila]
MTRKLPGYLTAREPVEADHAKVTVALSDWWGGLGGAAGEQQRALLVPRLMFQHFATSSTVLERDGRIAAFLIGFLSQSRPAESYIHFVGVDPALRGLGVGGWLYERFFAHSRANGRTVVRAITSPANAASHAFHTRMGFVTEPGPAEFEGRPVQPDYDGPGLDRLSFRLDLGDSATP